MELTNKTAMSSLELAQVTGKRHDHLLKSIRNMELAWQNVGNPKFGVSTYSDSSGKKNIMYSLNKEECLYVATKFNDEARAKVIMRWKALEESRDPLQLLKMAVHELEAKEQQILLQEQSIKEAAPKVEYCNKVLQSESTYVTNQIAKELGMSARSLNKRLKEFGVQYNQSGTWVLYKRYEGHGYTKTKTHHYYNSLNDQCTSMQTVWTEKGRMFIHDFFKHKKRIDLL